MQPEDRGRWGIFLKPRVRTPGGNNGTNDCRDGFLSNWNEEENPVYFHIQGARLDQVKTVSMPKNPNKWVFMDWRQATGIRILREKL